MSSHRVVLRYSIEETIERCDDSGQPDCPCTDGMQAKQIGLVRINGCEDGGVDEEAPGDGHELVMVAHE